MESAWQHFLNRLASPDLSFSYDEVCLWNAGEYAALIASQLLVEVAPATRVMCEFCEQGHWEPIRRSGDGRSWISCRWAGAGEIDPQRLRRWRVGTSQLNLSLAKALDPSFKPYILPDCHLIWHLGRRRIGRYTPYFFFAAVGPDELDSVTLAVRAAFGSVNSVLVVPFVPQPSHTNEDLRVVDIARITTLGDSGLVVDLSLIEAQFGLNEPKENLAERPSKALKAHRMSILRQYMDDKHIPNMEALAGRVHIDRSAIYAIVREDRSKSSLEKLAKLLEKIGCSLEKWNGQPEP